MKKMALLTGILVMVFGMTVVGCVVIDAIDRFMAPEPPTDKGGIIILRNTRSDTEYWYVYYQAGSVEETFYESNTGPRIVNQLGTTRRHNFYVDTTVTILYRRMNQAEIRDANSAAAAVRENKSSWSRKTVNISNGGTFEVNIP